MPAADGVAGGSLRPNAPLVSGISPHQGSPGTQVTIRGQNLGEDPNDLVALIICGTDCLAAAKWKSSSKIITRLGGQAKRGPGDIFIVTRSGGRGQSEVQFRVFIEQIGPLQESIVWVDETKTVPGRNLIRNVTETSETEDALGLGIDPQKRLDHSNLLKLFPDASGSRKMENFNPSWYLLENYKNAGLHDLSRGLQNLEDRIKREDHSSKQLHKANLFPLISCVDALAQLQTKIQQERKIQKETGKEWPLTISLAEKLDLAKKTADQLFRDVLSRKDAADSTRNALSVLTRFRFIFFLSEQIEDNMAKGEYATILNDYARAKALFKDTEVSLFKEVMAVLDEKVDRLRGIIRQKLMDISTPFDEQSRLIKYLKMLDPESDPAWDCMMAFNGWMESMLWELQKQYHGKAIEEEQRRLAASSSATVSLSEIAPSTILPPSVSSMYDFDTPKAPEYFRQAFVADLLALLTEKLHTFWKISQNFAVTGQTALAMATSASLAEAAEMQERQMDIDQMVTNTINVGSWLLLNALVPAALPEAVTNQYKDQFVEWPRIGSEAQWAVMFPAIKTLRTSIKTLIDCQLSRSHLQPLMELCITMRLKCLGMLIERGKETIIGLGVHEGWRVDLAVEPPRTELPDRFETEVAELLAEMKCVLATNSFPGETDLFIKEKWRQMITDLFTVLLLGIRDCYDRLLKLRHRGGGGSRRPNTLSDSASISTGSADEEGVGGGKKAGGGVTFATGVGISTVRETKPQTQEQLSRKFLATIANMDFILSHSLPGICRKLGENGLKFADQVFKRTKDKFVAYRNSLLSHYITQKSAQIQSILEAANFSHLPDEDDASDFVKELMLCAVFVQAEMAPYCPQFTEQVLADLVKVALERLFDSLSRVDFSSSEYATQVIVNLTSFEEAFHGFVTDDMSGALKSIRARLMNRLDNRTFRNALLNFRTRMALTLDSLQQYQPTNGIDQRSQSGSQTPIESDGTSRKKQSTLENGQIRKG